MESETSGDATGTQMMERTEKQENLRYKSAECLHGESR